MEYAIARLVADLRALQASDAVKLVDAAGDTEADWQTFLEKQQEILGEELARIVSDIMTTQIEKQAFHE